MARQLTAKQQAKRLEAEIERVYRARCSGIPIDVFDIAKVYEAGRKAAAAGQDVGDAVVAFVETIRRDK